MIKRMAALIAGILIVGGTAYAGGSVDFSGTAIQQEMVIIDSDGVNKNDDSNDKTNAKLNFRYQKDDNTKIIISFNTDDQSDLYDRDAEAIFYKKEGNITAQFDLNFSFGNSDDTHYVISEDADSEKTFIKWQPTSSTFFRFQPFNMGLVAAGKIFKDGDSFSEMPGVTVQYKDFYFGFGSDTAEFSTSEELVTAIKAGYKYKNDKITARISYSGIFFDKDQQEYTYRGNYLGESKSSEIDWVTDAVNGFVIFKPGKSITLTAEAGYVKLLDGFVGKKGYFLDGDKQIDSGYGIGLKGEYEFEAYKRKATPYILGKYVTDGYLVDSDMEDLNRNTNKVRTNGVKTLIAGIDYKLEKHLTLSGEVTRNQAGKNIYDDKDSALLITTKVTYVF